MADREVVIKNLEIGANGVREVKMNIIENGKFIMEFHPESSFENIDAAREYYALAMTFQDPEYQQLNEELNNVKDTLFAFYNQQFNEKYMLTYNKVNDVNTNLKDDKP